jgi:RimJ/RimL family protein N-acetyltransferase
MIYSERLRLRAAERADLPLFTRWLNDPEVRKNLSLYLPLSIADEEHWFETMLQNPPAEHALVIEIPLPDSDDWQPIGNCSLMNIDWRNRKAEFGIFIGEKSLWNKGYGTDTARLILKHGFETLNLHRIFLQVFVTNPGAIRAYEKAGFVHEGRLRQGMFLDGAYVDVLLMSVLRTEWASAKG